VIIPQLLSRTPEGFYQLLVKEQVTVLNQTPSAFRQLVAAEESLGSAEELPLRVVIFGGEALETSSLQPWMERHGEQQPRLVNMYGITETTVHVTYHPVRMAEVAAGGWSRIGRAIGDLELYVLDGEMEPVAVGVNGEMYVGGAGVARNYVNRAELTAERFVPDPYGREAGRRLYRTGDVGRYRADGELDYIGRRDEQVKVRGYRIELGEIEAVLRGHEWVSEATVVVREDVVGDKRLVAYVVKKAEALGGDVVELRQYVKEWLPDYMAPAAFVEVAEMPLTPNGKVDRSALPAPDRTRIEREEYVAPRTPVEQTLAGIWSEVLRVEQVSIHDNFFELGGDSILTIQIISRANRAGLQLTPRQLFEHQTIATLAAAAGADSVVQAEQGVVSGEVFLTPIQNWFFKQQMIDAHHFNQAVMIAVAGGLDLSVLEQAVNHLVAHHDALRLRFQASEGGWRQSNAGVEEHQVFEVREILGGSREERAQRLTDAATEVQRSLDLERGPLVRVAYFELGEGEARVLMAIHHLAVDGVSWRILLEDLGAAYEQLSGGAAVELPAKTTSYQQWARRLVEYASSAEVEQEINYWTDERWEQVSSLRVDSEGGENSRESLGTVTVVLDREQTRALVQEAPQVYHTQINDVLLTALAQALGKWSGTEKVLIDLEGHGREDIFGGVDVSRTVGWFTTIYPVLLEVPGSGPGDSVEAAALKSVKEQLRATPRRGIGYGVLRYLSSDASVTARLKALPQAEVSFNYRGDEEHGLSRSGFWTIAEHGSGATESESAQRAYLLEINAMIADSELRVTWSYSRNLHRRETIEQLAANYLGELEQLIQHCQSPEAGGYTPSDFPLARLTQEWLDQANREGWQIEDIYGLSPLQQGMLFHSLYAPNVNEYLVQVGYQLSGGFNLDAFERSWQQVVERHDLLRSSFHWEDLTEPVQIVHRNAKMPFVRHDWRGLSTERREAELQKYMLMDRERGFEFAIPPLMRLATARIEERGYWILWTFHHLLLDGWSMPHLIKEVFTLYQAETRGLKPQLEASRPYAGYIRWLRQQNMADAEAYWRNRLNGFSEPTPLPLTLSPGSVLAESRYAEQRRELSKAATQQLRDFSRQQQVTINTVVQAAWALLLGRYSGESDLVYGATVSGRPAGLDGVEEMIGLFINTLPVRVEVRGEQRISEWLRQLQTDQMEMRQYEYSPLMEVQRWSEVARGRALFESVVVFENFPLEAVFAQDVEPQVQDTQPDAIEITNLRSRGWTNYPLTLIAMPGGRLSLTIGYDSGRFEAGQAETIANNYERLLAEIIRDSAQQLWQIQLLTESERQQIIFQWNQTEQIYPPAYALSQLFEDQVERTPEATALVFGQVQLSYRELNDRANQLVGHLQQFGVELEDPVAVCMERSVEMIVSLLAILKATGTYVPLDPAYPTERLSLMLADAGAQLLLTQEHLQAIAPPAVRVVFVDSQWPLIAAHNQSNPVSESNRWDQLAYITYTSGSTGRPKGVCIPQRAVRRLVKSPNYVELSADESILQLAPLGFDASTFEIWGSLLNGGRLVMMGAEQPTLEDIGRVISEQQVTTMWLTSGLFHLMVDEQLESLGGVRQLLAGGDVLSVAHVERLRARWPECVVINGYGPTENTTFTACHRVGVNEELGSSVPIGRAITNTQVYVVDRAMEVAPVGVAGELYTGGEGLARGYVGDAAQTAERFVPDPFSGEEGRRLYRTGDLVRYVNDGTLEYIGRRDEQVKVRGYRIELGEVEAVLREHSAVREAVVILRSDAATGKRLVAYVVQADAAGGAESDLSPTTLRQYLQERLPDYMAPSDFLLLDTLPLTAHGKLDRRALLESGASRLEVETVYVAPRTSIEEQLAGIWSEVLRVDRVGIHDNFFTLGGQSLLAMQVISRVRKAFQIELPVYPLFANPTVEGLAAAVAQSQLDQKDNPATVISKIDPVDESYLLTRLDELSEAEVDLLLEDMIRVETDK
jgi:amino acid adenylation domain-containing protein/non-ribosomal peptide synthase protein (TIGR01720 family)